MGVAVKCKACGATPLPDESGTLRQAQFWRCFQTSKPECWEWAICFACLDRCEVGLRQRTYENGGMMPPPLEPSISPPAAAAAAASPPEHSDVESIFASLRRAVVVFDEDDTDEDEEANLARREAFKQRRCAANHTSLSQDQGAEFLPLSPKVKAGASLFPVMSDHHSRALEKCADLRNWPHAQLYKDSGERRVEFGASNLQWAGYHGYVTMELDVVSLSVAEEYDFKGKWPLKIDFQQNVDYNPITRTHGKDTVTFCTWVCARARHCCSMQWRAGNMLILRECVCVCVRVCRMCWISRRIVPASCGCKYWRGARLSTASPTKRLAACSRSASLWSSEWSTMCAMCARR
jgi:hypothetical protein